ncbi:MAG: LPS assembly lipoprotein LptE [Polaromonas sp.]|nr:LPS assembly lipoprotein LptE [Polaromonas sp.]
MQRRAFLSLSATAAALGLAGCGFALRKAPDFAFTKLYTSMSGSTLGVELRRSLQSTRKVEVITDARRINEAEVVLDVLSDQREKVVLSTNAAGQVREFQLRLRFRFRLRTLAGKELIPDTEILQQRDISFNESAVLAKEAEENLLYRDMQNDIVQQIMRRLAAVTEL